MPLTLTFADPCTFVVRASGSVTYGEAHQMRDEILAHYGLIPGARILVDSRTQTGAPSGSELRMIATELVPLVERQLGPVAIVCGSTFIYGVSRMFALFAEIVGANVGAFRDIDEATEWLESQPVAS